MTMTTVHLKPQKCKRCKYQWLKNITITDLKTHGDGSRSGSIKFRGLYKCVVCGNKKTGAGKSHNEAAA